MKIISAHLHTIALAVALPFGALLYSPAPVEVIYEYTASGDLKLFCFQPPGVKSGEPRPAASRCWAVTINPIHSDLKTRVLLEEAGEGVAVDCARFLRQKYDEVNL